MTYLIDYFERHKKLSSTAVRSKAAAGCFTLIVFLIFVTVNVLWLFLTVPRIGLQYVIVVFTDHTHLFSAFADNKGTGQPVYPHCLVSVIVINIGKYHI